MKTKLLSALKRSSFFSCVDEAALRKMVGITTHETWPQGRGVLAQDIQEVLYFIVSGRVKVVQANEETGRTVTLFLLGPGDIFDILQLLDNLPDNSLFEARDDLELLAIPIMEARQWINQIPEFNRAFLPYLGKMMRQLEELAANLALHDTETRLAHLIVRHLDSERHNSLRLIHDMSHESLAEMIGSVRVVVNRQLQNWRKQGIVSTNHGRITIERLEALFEKAGHHLPGRRREDNHCSRR